MKRAPAVAGLPLVLLGSACATSFRAGPDLRSQPAGVAMEARATIALGTGRASDGDAVQVTIPLSVSGGSRLADGESEGTFDAGGELTEVYGTFGYRAGLRLGTSFGSTRGGYASVRGGPLVMFAPAEEGASSANLYLEALLGIGTGGDLQGALLYGVGLTFGLDSYEAFRLPSGRPLRDGEGAPWRGRVRLGSRSSVLAGQPLRRDERERVGLAYLEDGLDELASIAAFERLSLELAALGAPPHLIARTRRAAREEASHARACFTLAGAHLGRDVRPPAVPAARARPGWTIRDLARESWLDGCVGEGLAADAAAQRAGDAAEPQVREVHAMIASDERGHARLAWDVLGWCVAASRDTWTNA